MSLSETARERLADVVELQPTKNSELQDRWGMDSGSEVHSFLESELSDYYYRDDNSLIRATPEAAELVDVDPGIEDEAGVTKLRVDPLNANILEVLPGPDERSISVVSTLQALRSEFDIDPSVDEVRSGLKRLARQSAVETVHRTVPTYRRSHSREELDIAIKDE